MGASRSSRTGVLSIVVPLFNEEASFATWSEVVNSLAAPPPFSECEFVFVDDASTDATPKLFGSLARTCPRVKYTRLSRNSASHIASTVGLRHVRGDLVLFFPADLQKPLDIVPQCVQQWQEGADVIWGDPPRRQRASLLHGLFAQTYWVLVRYSDLDPVAREAASLCGVTRRVADLYGECAPPAVNMLTFMGRFPGKHAAVTYEERERRTGKSGWNYRKRIKLWLDTFFDLADWFFPGALVCALVAAAGGALGALVTLVRWATGHGPDGLGAWLVLLVGGATMAVCAVAGEMLRRLFRMHRTWPEGLQVEAGPSSGEEDAHAP